tara:strand:+ start:1212 stop:1469 length:258 start_codon:yes stop_codon:yes gene_type:complete
MSTKATRINQCDSLKEDALVLTGLDEAVEGVSDCGRLIYDYEKVLKIFMDREGWTAEDAEEWVGYNVMGVQPNGAGFIMMTPLSD